MVVAQTIYGEARGERDDNARIGVANVISNRFRANRAHYGEDFSGVCLHPWQYSCWNENDPNLSTILDPNQHKTDMYKVCLEIARRAIEDRLDDLTGGALHYYSDTIAKPDWAFSSTAEISVKIGGHIFYINVD